MTIPATIHVAQLQKIYQNQRLRACGLSDHYRQIFELTRLNEAITSYPSEAEALKAVTAAG